MHRSPDRPETALPARTRRLYFTLTLTTPFVFFLLLELVLRLTNYGPSIQLFVRERRGDKEFLVMNPDVRHRYFQTVEFTPTTSHDFFQSPKPAGVIRIFCLGGSTTVGFPYGYAGSFPAFLRDRLERIFPSKKFEIINLGMTATNSNSTLDIAKELPDYEPDLILVYDGHNEFYGALGSASREKAIGTRWMTALHLRMIHWKTYRAFRDILSWVSSMVGRSPEAVTGTMMEHLAKDQLVPINSDQYSVTLETFESNFRELSDLCRESSVPLVLGTQVSNLRDQPPFVSKTSGDLPDAQRELVRRLTEEALAHQASHHHVQAAEVLRQALSHDSTSALLYYHLGRSSEALARQREALDAYVRARDYDMLRFRTDTRFNNVILNLRNTANVAVAHCEKTFKTHSPDSLIGFNLLLEHLHPNLEGNFLLANAYVEAIRRLGVLGTPKEWLAADTLDEDLLRAQRIVTSLDRFAAEERIAVLMSGWPFNRPRAPERENNLLTPLIDSLLYGSSSWEEVHVAAAQLYMDQGMLAEAEVEFRSLADQLPQSASPLLGLGQVLLSQKRTGEAISVFRKSLELERTPFALIRIGALALEKGEIQNAIPRLEEAYSLSAGMSERIESAFFLALACYRKGDVARSRQLLEHVVSLSPDHRPALQLLQRLRNRSKGNEIR